MSRVSSSDSGYTIVEALIFLAVSGAMFTMAALLIAGQQSKAEFQQGIRDFESQVQDISNDISNGYYATSNDLKCTISGGRPATDSGGTAVGTNVNCIFVGKAIQFYPNGADGTTFDIYPVVGNKKNQTTNLESQNLDDAKPTAVAPGTSINLSSIDLKDRHKIPGGIKVGWVKYTDSDNLPATAGGFGIFTTFGSVSSGGGLQQGTVSVNILPIGTSSDGTVNSADFVESVGNLGSSSETNPASGIEICLQSAGTNQYVIMTVGGKGRTFGTKTEFYAGNCP